KEVIYAAPLNDYQRTCSTFVHEFQHLVNFDSKVFSKLSDSEKPDMREMEKANLREEHLGINEGLSHVLEVLSDQRQIVNEHIYNFLIDPNGTSLALETEWNSFTGNSRSRGLNT